MQFQFLVISFLLQIVSVFLYSDNEIQTSNNATRVLSRKKRYLIFPAGSSLQLVYCLTMPTYGMGQIFTIGLTAALAWELPKSLDDYKKPKQTTEASNRVDKPTNNLIYVSSAQTSPQYHYITNQWLRPYLEQSVRVRPTSNHAGHDWEHLPAYRNRYLYRKHGDVHRRTRRELFTKIEKFFEAQNKDGRACLLKALCEVNQTSGPEKGTFVEEILRAIFTWMPGENETEHVMYDDAAMHKGNCTEKFPTCTQSVWNPFF